METFCPPKQFVQQVDFPLARRDALKQLKQADLDSAIESQISKMTLNHV